jgi:hypothetical protein
MLKTNDILNKCRDCDKKIYINYNRCKFCEYRRREEINEEMYREKEKMYREKEKMYREKEEKIREIERIRREDNIYIKIIKCTECMRNKYKYTCMCNQCKSDMRCKWCRCQDETAYLERKKKYNWHYHYLHRNDIRKSLGLYEPSWEDLECEQKENIRKNERDCIKIGGIINTIINRYTDYPCILKQTAQNILANKSTYKFICSFCGDISNSQTKHNIILEHKHFLYRVDTICPVMARVFNMKDEKKFPKYGWNYQMNIPLINFNILLHIKIILTETDCNVVNVADAINIIQNYVIVKQLLDIVLQYEGQLLFDLYP